MYWIGVAAAVLLVIGVSLTAWRVLSNGEQHLPAAVINFATSIERGIGSPDQNVPGAMQAYPRKVLLITINLPPGSEDGMYEFQVLQPNKKAPLIQAQSKAKIANGLTTLTQTVDFSRMEPGVYVAQVKHPPFGQWRRVPIRIE
jgi:hypothetical protein